ncbi:MAG: hypothetical protein CME26_14655 [Gemmatimonadetes bacterium]|nr:hypothetical protein [Gemmatimonadota bacterium]
MTCFRRRRARWFGAVVAGLLIAACGRERTNPIDPNFAGNEALNPPTNIQAEGDIGRIRLRWNAVASSGLKGYGIWRSTVATEGYVRLGGEVADTLITTARTTFVDSTVDIEAAKVYFYRLTTVDVVDRQSELSVFVSAEAQDDARPPDQPTDLSAVADPSSGFVTLTWNAPLNDLNSQPLTGLENYKVFRSQDSQDAFVQIGEVPSPETTFVDSSTLVVGSQYFYRVSAVDGDENEGGRSTSASLTTANTGLETPTGLQTASRIDAIDVSWMAVDDPSLIGYLVLRSTDTQATFNPVTADTLFTTALTTYVDSNVVVDQVYFYKIQAVADDPQLGLRRSAESTFTDGVAVSDETPPSAPSDLIASLNETDLGRVSLTWTPPTSDSDGNDLTGLAGYRIFRSKESSSSFILLAEIDALQEAFEDTTVGQLTIYFYAISAIDEVGNVGPRSTSANVTTGGVATPRNAAAVSGIERVTVSWSPNTEAELISYRVLRFADPSDTSPQATFTTLQTTFVDSPLTVGETVVYKVQAVATGGLESDLSLFVSAVVGADDRAPDTPSQILLEGPSSTTIQVSWRAPRTDTGGDELTGLDTYRVYRALETESAGLILVAEISSSSTAYLDEGLTMGSTYIYRVSSADAEGNESVLSSAVSRTALGSGIVVPTNVQAQATATPDVMVSWTATGNFDSFSVQRKEPGTDSGSGNFITVANSLTTTSYVDTTVLSGRVYVYRVVARLGSSFGDESAEIAVAVP